MGPPPDNLAGVKKRGARAGLRRLVQAVFLLAFIWSPCCPKYYSSCGPVASPSNAWFCPIPLPDSARNIQYKHFSFFQAYETYVRFEAPVEDCIKHAEKALDECPTRDYSLYYRPGPLRPMGTQFPERHPSTACSAAWFDIENIKIGLTTPPGFGPGSTTDRNRTQAVTYGSGGPMIPQIWVDTDRGVFYFLLTD